MSETFGSTLEFINALKAGDNRAYEQLYRKYFDMVASFVLKNNGTMEDAREVFQESVLVLLHKVRNDKDFDLKVELGTFLFAIARNTWLSQLRKKKTQVDIGVEDINVYEAKMTEEQTNDQENEQNELIENLKKYLANLKQDCQDVIMATFYKKLSGRETAVLLGYTEDFVKVKKYRCLEELRKKFI